MYNYHGGKLVQRGPNPLSSHITVRLRSSRDIVYFVCIFFATHFFNFFVKRAFRLLFFPMSSHFTYEVIVKALIATISAFLFKH
jgi:hypothetical protein